MEAVAVAKTISCVWSTAVAAFNISQTLYVFCQDTKAVDSNVRELCSETSSLASACESLHRLLDNLSREDKGLIERRDSHLCKEIERCVEDFNRTIAQLEGCIKDVKDKRSDSVFKQGVRTVKLNLKKDDIKKIRQRIAAHHLSVQTNIATLNTHISLTISTALQLRILKHELDQLETKKQVVQANIQVSNNQAAEDTSSSTQEYALLVEKADEVLSNGGSIYEGSEVDASKYLADWLISLKAISEERPCSPEYSVSTSSRLVTSQTLVGSDADGLTASLSSQMEQQAGEPRGSSGGDDSAEEDSDEESFEIELAKNAYDAGIHAFFEKDFALAKSMLLESLSLCQRLSPSQRFRICDTWDLRFALAVCSSHTDNARDAQATLIECLHSTSSTKEQRRLMLWLSMLLAMSYVRSGELELALQSSESALKGYRKLVGKNNDATYRSLALTGRIYELRGMPVRARGYLDFIPSHCRTMYATEHQALGPGSSDYSMECLPPWQPKHAPSPIDDKKAKQDSNEMLEANSGDAIGVRDLEFSSDQRLESETEKVLTQSISTASTASTLDDSQSHYRSTTFKEVDPLSAQQTDIIQPGNQAEQRNSSELSGIFAQDGEARFGTTGIAHTKATAVRREHRGDLDLSEPLLSTVGIPAAIIATRAKEPTPEVTSPTITSPQPSTCTESVDPRTTSTRALEQERLSTATLNDKTLFDNHDFSKQTLSSSTAPPYTGLQSLTRNALDAAVVSRPESSSMMSHGWNSEVRQPARATNLTDSGALGAQPGTKAESTKKDAYIMEQRHQAALRASAVSMAKQMYEHASQAAPSPKLNSLPGDTRRDVEAAPPGSPTISLKPNLKEEAMRYIHLQDAAHKLAQERLAKLDQEMAGNRYRENYRYGDTSPKKSGLSVRQRPRGSGEGNLDNSLDDDWQHAQEIRSQMSQLSSGGSPMPKTSVSSSQRRLQNPSNNAVDSDSERQIRQTRSQTSKAPTGLSKQEVEKRRQDREKLMAAAKGRVSTQMRGMDKKLFAETGKVTPAMRQEFERKAQAEVAEQKAEPPKGRIAIGGGRYIDQAEIEAMAAARLKPTFEEINKTAERKRAKDEETKRQQDAEVMAKAEFMRVRGEFISVLDSYILLTAI